MTEKQSLSSGCADTHKAILDALEWTRNEINVPRTGSTRSLLDRELRRAAIKTDRLQKAVERPMCVGVFGPSQVGKSYLISALARHGTDPLVASFDGIPQDLDFVRQINPEGGEESTGVVTRFSIRPAPTPQGYPVKVRLLSQTDLVKILGNAFFADCELNDEKIPDQADLDAIVADIRSHISETRSAVSEEDIWDLQEYFEQGEFKGQPIIRALSSIGYWDIVSQLATKLSTEGRSVLFSMLWGQLSPFTRVYSRLVKKLEDLGNPSDAFCTIESLVIRNGDRYDRREDSIVNVKTLDTLEENGEESLEVCASTRRTAKFARADLAALVAELCITMRARPADFFDYTDLLDFPGARSRGGIGNIKTFLRRNDALKHLFIRGKVAYLFERYNAEQELTSMLLCVGPGVQEVRTLPRPVKSWIDVTHGETPALRADNQTSLFLVLTKFDMEFEQAAGKSEDSSERWTRRLNNSLTKFFGQANDWPREWKPGAPFNNTFWLRNPNVANKAILDYSVSGEEIGIRASEKARIDRAQREFLANADVRRHFHDPVKAWDEAFRLKDGGITYLADSLRPVCNPEIKLRQIAARLDALRNRITSLLRPYYFPLDLGDRWKKRAAVCQSIAEAAVEANERGRLGSFIRRMGIESVTLKEALYSVRVDAPKMERVRASYDEGDHQRAHTKPVTVTAGAHSKTQADILRKLIQHWAPIQSTDKPPSDKPTSAKERKSKHERAAVAALECWSTALYDLSQDRSFADAVGVSSTVLSEVQRELIAAADRFKLEEKIAGEIKKVAFATDHKELFADKATVVAGSIINRFASTFGGSESADEQPRSLRFDGTIENVFERPPANPTPESLPSEACDFLGRYLLDWVLAMEDSMRANVEGGNIGSPEEREQNEILGTVLQYLQNPGSLKESSGPL